MERFVDNDAGYLRWLVQHPDGYVLNAFPHLSSAYLVLHRASCRTICQPLGPGRRLTRQYGKVCSDGRSELESWVRREARRSVKACGSCLPGEAPPRRGDEPQALRAAKGTAGTQAHPAQAGSGKLGHADAGPRLFELAYSCRLYAHMTAYDVSLAQLRGLGPELDPYDGAHQAALFVWLNSWGCRQFAKEQHATIAARSLTRWSSTWLRRLPGPDVHLTSLSADQIRVSVEAYGALRDSEASRRALPSGQPSRVAFGPTGAAKTLFALRPNVFPPWDDPIRINRGWGSDSASFEAYLLDTAERLQRLSAEAGVRVSDLPRHVGRPDSSPPKLIDEYNWVTVTRRCPPPTAAEVATWARWAAAGSGTS